MPVVRIDGPNGNGAPEICETCLRDLDPPPAGDNLVNVHDLFMAIGAWGPCANPNDCPADIAPAPTGDDIVDVQDLLAVIGAWGGCP